MSQPPIYYADTVLTSGQRYALWADHFGTTQPGDLDDLGPTPHATKPGWGRPEHLRPMTKANGAAARRHGAPAR